MIPYALGCLVALVALAAFGAIIIFVLCYDAAQAKDAVDRERGS